MRTPSSPAQVLAALRRPRAGRATRLVGVDGCGGSGKSVVAEWVALSLPGLVVLHMDDFYVPDAREDVGGHFDWRRLEREVLSPLRRDEVARYQVYDWAAGELGEWREVPPGGGVVVEGVTATRLELASAYDLTIWVDCPRELRLARGLARDGEGARSKWERDWMPAEDAYVAAHRPDERADLVVDGVTFLPS
jgi:uridine kinase